MKNKQTAVDWLESVLESQCMIKIFAFEDEIYFRKLLNQSKKMEKEQIKESFVNAYLIAEDGLSYDFAKIIAEQYYNETYKQQDNGN